MEKKDKKENERKEKTTQKTSQVVDKNISANKVEILKEVLYKKALGYEIEESTEEFVVDETNNEKLTKRKVTKKYVPPDISAAKILLETFSDDVDYSKMTDEELEQERLNMIKCLSEQSFIQKISYEDD